MHERAWLLNPLSSLSFRHFDGEWVVFDEGGGQTYAFDSIAAASLMILEEGETTQEQLVLGVAESLELIPELVVDRLTQALTELAAFGLVRHKVQ